MNIKISEAYKALAQLELASKKKSLNINSIKEEIQTSNEELVDDINEFNQEVGSLNSSIENSEPRLTKESLIKMRGSAMDIETIFSNLVEEIDKFIQNSDFHDSD